MSEEFPITEPGYNIADTDTSGMLEFYQKQLFLMLEKSTPAKIISYDRDKNRAIVQPLAYAVNSNGNNITRKELIDIPVFNFGGGNFVLSFPIKQGDIGFIYAADGNISVFKKILDMFAPATEQRHKYKDGIFYPLILNGFTISGNDKNAVLLSSLDGATKISLTEGKAEITAIQTIINSDVVINGNLTAKNITGNKVISLNGATGTYSNSVTTANGIVINGS